MRSDLLFALLIESTILFYYLVCKKALWLIFIPIRYFLVFNITRTILFLSAQNLVLVCLKQVVYFPGISTFLQPRSLNTY